MDSTTFHTMVQRLERLSAEQPRTYHLRVAALAALGLAMLAALMGMAALALLLLVGIVVGALVSGGGALLLLAKLGKLLVFLVLPLWFMLKAGVQALFTRLPKPQGEPVSRSQAPELFKALETMRQQQRGPRVHEVLVVDEVNAAIVQRPLFGLIGFPRNTMLLGLPLLEAMTPQEALAVVAHEYAHLAGAHGRFAAFIYRLRGSWAGIQEVAAQWQGFVGRWLARAVAWYAPYFNAYTFVLARANEYTADRSAAEVVGAPAVASALKRVNLASAQYSEFISGQFARTRELAAPPADLSQQWAGAAARQPDTAPRWLQQALDHPGAVHDTHPTLRARLQALNAGAMDDLPPPLPGESAAHVWLWPVLNKLRDRAQRRWADAVAQPWARMHEEVRTRRERLQALMARTDLDRRESFERLRLRGELEDGLDLREDYARCNAQFEDDALGLYLEGLERLAHDDDGGHALLERAMTLDAEAIKPGCEQAHRHCLRRGDREGAQRYAERWQARDAFETQRELETNELDTRHALRPHGLDEAALATVMQRLTPAARQGVAALYLVRRVLPSDAERVAFVLGVQPTTWARLRSQDAQIIERLAALEWPAHIHVVNLAHRRHAAYRGQVQAVPGALLAG